MDKFKRLDKSKMNKVQMQRMLKDSKVPSQASEATTRIDSPIAKYDSAGNLTCIICKSIVKSANVWKVHINSKQHKQKLDLAKQQKIPAGSPVSALQLKQQSNITNTQQNDNKKAEDLQKANKRIAPIDPPISVAYVELLPQNGPTSKDTNVAELLPEKFFDDPVSDAKARNVEPKDTQDEEWARFQREIKEESTMSNAIIAEEQDDENLKRQIFEIDDQIKKWSKVIEITEKKKHISRSNNERNAESFENEVANSSDDSDIGEEVEDWRIKRLH